MDMQCIRLSCKRTCHRPTMNICLFNNKTIFPMPSPSFICHHHNFFSNLQQIYCVPMAIGDMESRWALLRLCVEGHLCPMWWKPKNLLVDISGEKDHLVEERVLSSSIRRLQKRQQDCSVCGRWGENCVCGVWGRPWRRTFSQASDR